LSYINHSSTFSHIPTTIILKIAADAAEQAPPSSDMRIRHLSPKGYHTPTESGLSEVPVREMKLNTQTGLYEFTTEGVKPVTIYWNPDKLELDIPSNTGHQDSPSLPSSITVLPIPEKVGSDIESYPAPTGGDFEDYILVFLGTYMPPIYIYLSNNPNDPIWTERKKITPVKNAYKHWEKHGNEFPELINAKEYVDATHDFVNSPPDGTLTKTRENGDTPFYNPESNILGVRAKNGAPRTMFKPTDKMDYWNEQ